MFSQFLSAIALSAVADAYIVLEQPQLENSFDVFINKYNKMYTLPEVIERQHVYNENEAFVKKLNSNPADSAVYSTMGQFGDRKVSELFIEPSIMAKIADSQLLQSHKLPELSLENLPEHFDWRKYGAVTKVRNQGSVGSCWSFSAAEAIEGAQFLKHDILRELSPEFMVECDPLDCGIFGGFPYQAFEFVKKEGGIPYLDALPYCAGSAPGTPGACTPCMAPHYDQTLCGNHKSMFCNHSRNVCDLEKLHPEDIGAKVENWFQVSEDEEQIKAALVKYGPLSVALNANWLQFYTSGISAPFVCDPSLLNHAVLLVGYGTGTHWITGQEQPYWIVKNSWGSTWGESGYFKIQRGTGTCGINTNVVFATVV